MGPVTVQGKMIMRDLMQGSIDWDEPLPSTNQHASQWITWKNSLPLLKQIQVPRVFSPESFSQAARVDLLVFSDASELAISAVSYLMMQFQDGKRHIGFVMGKCKVAPTSGHTIPRLELCAAVLATEIAETVKDSLGVQFHSVKFYTDSKVILGYICNQKRRFYTYVANRVEKIRRFCSPDQWNFIPTHLNPADDGTRGLTVDKMQDSRWLSGPLFLLKPELEPQSTEVFPLIGPEEDSEIRKEVKVLKTDVSTEILGTTRFEKFSSWKCLVKAVSRLRHIASSFRKDDMCHGWHICEESVSVKNFEDSANFVLREVQHEVYFTETELLSVNRSVPKNSSICTLDPFISPDVLLRVGGRLNKAHCLTSKEKNPVILPGKHYVARLIVTHFHELVKHQGRHFTESAVRAGGFWITGGKRLVSSVIFRCIKCRKFRGRFECQKMSDLPADRLEQTPPFTYVGLDTFGPWPVLTRRTRGGQANSKRWAILFTCLCVRAVHIEVV